MQACTSNEEMESPTLNPAHFMDRPWKITRVHTASGIDVTDDYTGDMEVFLTFKSDGILLIKEQTESEIIESEGTWTHRRNFKDIDMQFSDELSVKGNVQYLTETDLTIKFEAGFTDDFEEAAIFKFKAE